LSAASTLSPVDPPKPPTDPKKVNPSASEGGFGGSTGDSVEAALNHLANNFFATTSAPTAGTTGLAEGDLFYDTDDNQLKIYRETSVGTYEFVPIMIGNDSSDSDTIDAGSF
jgi:hypothetical protein